jgi:hypothetical protein
MGPVKEETGAITGPARLADPRATSAASTVSDVSDFTPVCAILLTGGKARVAD